VLPPVYQPVLPIPLYAPPTTTNAPPNYAYAPTTGPPSCPTTLIYTAPFECDFCVSTSYGYTVTDEVDCGGCATLVTSTTEYPFAGLCPVSLHRQRQALPD
jgi:hypothetical protein